MNNTDTTRTIDLKPIIDLAVKAGLAIMEVYNHTEEQLEVVSKKDNSPLTAADRASHQVIDAGLRALYPQIPVLSEEGAEIDYAIRKDWKEY